MRHVLEYRRAPHRLADLVPWAALVAPGVLLNKDGALQQTLQFRGPDLEASTPHELGLVALRLNNAFKRLPGGWALWIEAQRRPAVAYPQAAWPHPLSLLVDEERRATFAEEGAHFDTAYYLTLGYLLPPETTARVQRLVYEHLPTPQVDYREFLAYFQLEVARFRDLLADVLPSVQPLDDAATLTYLHSTVSAKSHPLTVPDPPMYLDVQLTDSAFVGGIQPYLGDLALRSLTLKAFPSASWAGMLDDLHHLPLAYRAVLRFLVLDKQAGLRLMHTTTRKWFARRKGLLALLREAVTGSDSPLEDPDATHKAQDAQAAWAALADDQVAYGYCTATVTVWDADPQRAADLLQVVERVINGRGLTTHAETLNAVEAWLGSLPGNTWANVRQPPLSTLNLAHLMPASAVWGGPERNTHLDGPPLCYARTGGATPFRVVLHEGDVGHTLILGPTGAGKTVLLNFLALQFLRYPGAQVYLFDKDEGTRATTLGVGGEHYRLGGDAAALAFQPLAAIDAPHERAWASDWVEGILTHGGVPVTPRLQEEIWLALTSLATAPPSHRTLTGLVHLLQEPTLRQALHPYTLAGPHGALLDAATDRLAAGRWQCFEMTVLMQTPKVVPPTLLYLFHRLEQQLTGAPTLLILDEAWLYLDHPRFAAQIREWLKVLRKANVSVLFATQSLADAADSPIAPAVIESCLTRLFLPNSRALEDQVAAYYRRWGLNERQLEILATATPKRQYYFQSRQGTRLFDLGLGPVALAFCGAGSPEDRTAMDTMLATHPPAAFAGAWLRHKGLAWAADLLDTPVAVDDDREATPALLRHLALPHVPGLEIPPQTHPEGRNGLQVYALSLAPSEEEDRC
jgi:type IV secretion system protein VirB4